MTMEQNTTSAALQQIWTFQPDFSTSLANSSSPMSSSTYSSVSASSLRHSSHSVHVADYLGSASPVSETSRGLSNRKTLQSQRTNSEDGPDRRASQQASVLFSSEPTVVRFRRNQGRCSLLSHCSSPHDVGRQLQTVPSPPSMPRHPSALAGSPKRSHFNKAIMSSALPGEYVERNTLRATSDLTTVTVVDTPAVRRYASQIVSEARSELQILISSSSAILHPEVLLKDEVKAGGEHPSPSVQTHDKSIPGAPPSPYAKSANPSHTVPVLKHQLAQLIRSFRSATSEGTGRDSPDEELYEYSTYNVFEAEEDRQDQNHQLGYIVAIQPRDHSYGTSNADNRSHSLPQPFPPFRKASRSFLDDLGERTGSSSSLYFVGPSSPSLVNSSPPEPSMLPRPRTPSMHGGFNRQQSGVFQMPNNSETLLKLHLGYEGPRHNEESFSAPLKLIEPPSPELIHQISRLRSSRSVTGDGTGRDPRSPSMASRKSLPSRSILDEFDGRRQLSSASLEGQHKQGPHCVMFGGLP
ncbi:hypothetical protein CEUSTIGMA_g7934.t1 [Chlamydomonas eustigma]|uniref:Uncharacterized protein n=1 Tax=Chlamydomonas eustigma TaxID=1157962 RepID=A0A250XBQ5_9CHLO|nr:hypothetical protein CEUSTIGMA_g7934.t1 [Chlamydomonas eustigma]|eukprot:GAX80496.1 hypothetical protein CEUSTIGMA_g7934.t1 [Chlamydomonas eustigma]